MLARTVLVLLMAVTMTLSGCQDITKGDLKPVYTKPLTKLEYKIMKFIQKHGYNKVDPVETAIILAKAKHPRLMTAIACQESHFTPEAVGSKGELSMFQILEWPGGNPRDIKQSLVIAEQHLEMKIKDAKGSLWDGVRRYNGKGKQACKYRDCVRTLVKEIG